jgi:hypothetical protein
MKRIFYVKYELSDEDQTNTKKISLIQYQN